jgi:hypothetical protein
LFRSITRAITLATVVSLVLSTTALADNVIVDGDGIAPVATNSLAFGNVCLNATPSKSVLIAIDAAGHPGAGTNVFANSALVTFAAPTPSAGLAAGTPASITLPNNWTALGNTAMSSAVSASVSLLASGTNSLGAKSGTVGYSASGARSTSGTLTRAGALSASWTVISCDSTPPALSLPADITAEATSSAGAVVAFTATASDANPTSPAVTCSPASGSTFPLGTTTVNCSATDAAGNTGNGSFNVTVEDTTAPVIANMPTDLNVEAIDADGAVVTYSNPTATDSVDPASPAVTCVPASGSTFAIGTTEVACSATDAAGNEAASSFNVTVSDTTAPVLVVPSDISAEATSAAGAAVSFLASASDAVDGTVTPDCNWTSGSTFPLGATTVMCSATDQAGNVSDSQSFTVTIVDTTGPDISGTPGNQTLEATGADGATASWVAPTATDLVDGSVDVDCDHASGATFPLGATTVNCSATDAAHNQSSVSFTITVQDTTAPTIDGNDDQILEATSPTGAVATFLLTASDVVDGDVQVLCDFESGDTFALGDTTVTCSATDDHLNQATANFKITVTDTTAPALFLPADITAEATSSSGAVVSYTASAWDIVDGSVVLGCSPASGGTFPLGSTTVNCSATDDHGNTASGSFLVAVQDTTAPSLTVPANITASATSTSGAVVTYVATATDLVDGSVTPDCSPASGSTFPIGATTVNCSATDAHGNTSAEQSFSVQVNVQKAGFYQPVDMNGVWNTVKNGSTVPLKFELFAGSTELTTTNYVQGFSAQAVACPTNGFVADAIEVLATGSTVLRYDATAGQFIYNWQTPKKAGACYRVTMTAADGATTISANFILK